MKQGSTKHTYKTKDRVIHIRTPLKTQYINSWSVSTDRIDTVMLGVLVSSTVDREPWVGKTKDYKIGLCWFSTTQSSLEDYLSTLKHFNSRKILTKFRISDHKLEIEIGRYKKVPREQRICKACKVLDDEKHCFLHCHINYNIRNSLIQEIENYYPDFNQLDSIAKLKIILNPSQDILSNVVDYIKQSMELRK